MLAFSRSAFTSLASAFTSLAILTAAVANTSCGSTVPLGEGDPDGGGGSNLLPEGGTGADSADAISTGGGGSQGAGGGSQASGGSSPGAAGGSEDDSGVVTTDSLVSSGVSRDTSPSVSTADFQTFISDHGDFAFDVFGKVAPGESNFLYSPLSLEMALSMAYAGAAGQTATQMQQVFHDTLPDATFHSAWNSLALTLASRNIGETASASRADGGLKSTELRVVDATWAQKNYPFQSAYLDTLARDYGAGVQLVDFRNDASGAIARINQWASDQTAGKIQNLLAPGALTSDTRLVLTNALYFKANWSTPLLVGDTSTETFQVGTDKTVTVPMLHDTRYASYGSGDSYQIVDLPYYGAVSMTIVLPASGEFESLRSSLTRSWFEQARAQMTSTRAALSIPKFSFTWGTHSFATVLEALGMTDAFIPRTADFSGIESSRELYVSDVVQKDFIGVDESGTEAAAVSATIMAGSSADPGKPVDFVVNRPFFFVIRDATGALLFMGQVTDPTLAQ